MLPSVFKAATTNLATFLALSILLPSAASACRVPLQPAALRSVKADAIVLVKVASAEASSGSEWIAHGEIKGRLFGSHPKRDIAFANEGIISCWSMGLPQPGRYYVLYLERTNEGLRFRTGFPFWFARASEDSRLAKLNKIMPLGTARRPNVDERLLIDFAEPRVLAKTGRRDLSGYTRVYGRSSASGVSVSLIPSQSPQRLFVDDPAEFPTAESCSCDPVEVFIDMQDLWAAGKLPPFNPQ